MPMLIKRALKVAAMLLYPEPQVWPPPRPRR